jgi:hypothetical protein
LFEKTDMTFHLCVFFYFFNSSDES